MPKPWIALVHSQDASRMFGVRAVLKGERYGLNDVLTHDKLDPLIEFWDTSADPAKFGADGQFVSRYYASTLALGDQWSKPTGGLALQGGIPVWTVGAAGMDVARTAIRLMLTEVLRG